MPILAIYEKHVNRSQNTRLRDHIERNRQETSLRSNCHNFRMYKHL